MLIPNNPKINILKILSLTLLISLWSSCSKRDTIKTFTQFPISSKLENESISIPPILTYVEFMTCNSKHLITLNTKREKIFQVFTLPDLEFVNEFGEKGPGPNEFGLVMKFGRFNENFYIIDYSSLKVVNIADSLNLIFQKKLPGKLISLNEFVLLNDTLFIGTSTNELIKKEMFRYSYNSFNLEEFSEYPSLDAELHNHKIRFELFLKRLSINNKLDRLAVLYSKYPILKIYNTKSLNLEKELMYDCRINQTFEFNGSGLETENTYIFYKEIFTSDKFIYGLYIGRTPFQIDNEYENMKTSIHVWDWNANPVANYDLDLPIFKFIVYNDSLLIGITPEDESNFYKFELRHKNLFIDESK